MAMVTTVVTPPLLKLQFRSGEANKPAPKPLWQVFLRGLNPMLGLVVCTAVAVSLSLFLRQTSLRGLIPYGFLAVVVVAAKLWGGLLGFWARPLLLWHSPFFFIIPWGVGL